MDDCQAALFEIKGTLRTEAQESDGYDGKYGSLTFRPDNTFEGSVTDWSKGYEFEKTEYKYHGRYRCPWK